MNILVLSYGSPDWHKQKCSDYHHLTASAPSPATYARDGNSYLRLRQIEQDAKPRLSSLIVPQVHTVCNNNLNEHSAPQKGGNFDIKVHASMVDSLVNTVRKKQRENRLLVERLESSRPFSSALFWFVCCTARSHQIRSHSPAYIERDPRFLTKRNSVFISGFLDPKRPGETSFPPPPFS